MMPVGVAFSQTDGNIPLTIEEGLSFERKAAQIYQRNVTGGVENLRLFLFEREINSYLLFQAASLLPTGVASPTLSILENSRVATKATIDFDVLREEQELGFLGPFSFFGGRVSVVATFFVETEEGFGLLTLEDISMAGVSVPPAVFYQLVRYYTRSDSYPEGFDLDSRFELPYSIREVLLEIGRAVVVQ